MTAKYSDAGAQTGTLPAVRVIVLLLGLCLGACADETFEFVCETDQQCDAEGEGLCVQQWCSYADSGCDSGYRYSADSDPSVAEQCVPESAVAPE